MWNHEDTNIYHDRVRRVNLSFEGFFLQVEIGNIEKDRSRTRSRPKIIADEPDDEDDEESESESDSDDDSKPYKPYENDIDLMIGHTDNNNRLRLWRMHDLAYNVGGDHGVTLFEASETRLRELGEALMLLRAMSNTFRSGNGRQGFVRVSELLTKFEINREMKTPDDGHRTYDLKTMKNTSHAYRDTVPNPVEVSPSNFDDVVRRIHRGKVHQVLRQQACPFIVYEFVLISQEREFVRWCGEFPNLIMYIVSEAIAWNLSMGTHFRHSNYSAKKNMSFSLIQHWIGAQTRTWCKNELLKIVNGEMHTFTENNNRVALLAQLAIRAKVDEHDITRLYDRKFSHDRRRRELSDAIMRKLDSAREFIPLVLVRLYVHTCEPSTTSGLSLLYKTNDVNSLTPDEHDKWLVENDSATAVRIRFGLGLAWTPPAAVSTARYWASLVEHIPNVDVFFDELKITPDPRTTIANDTSVNGTPVTADTRQARGRQYLSSRGIVKAKPYSSVTGRAETCLKLTCTNFTKCASGRYTFVVLDGDRRQLHLRRVFNDMELRASHRCMDLGDASIIIGGECIIDRQKKTITYNFLSGTYSRGIMRRAAVAIDGFTIKHKNVDTTNISNAHVVTAVYRSVVEDVVPKSWSTLYTSRGLFLPNIEPFTLIDECDKIRDFVEKHVTLNGKPVDCAKF
jgi:hypothetical protein